MVLRVCFGFCLAWVWTLGEFVECVISTPVILNGGYIYTIALFKRGQRVCARTHAHMSRKAKERRVVVSPLGFLGDELKTHNPRS